MSLRRRVHAVVEEGEGPLGRVLAAVVTTLILLSVSAVMLETVDWIARDHARVLSVVEAVCVVVFTAEIVLRLWSCTVDPRFAHPVMGRLRYLVQPLTLIDLLAISPFYLPLLAPDLRVARIMRLVRLLRLLKVGRYSDTVRTLGRVLVSKREDLMVAASAVVVILVLSSCLMYHVEHEAQPEAFSSIPAAMWWGIATLTTVGYGDVYPVTTLGRLLGALIAVSGVGLVALPAGILASGFTDEMRRLREEREDRVAASAPAPPAAASHCPHCGGDLPR